MPGIPSCLPCSKKLRISASDVPVISYSAWTISASAARPPSSHSSSWSHCVAEHPASLYRIEEDHACTLFRTRVYSHLEPGSHKPQTLGPPTSRLAPGNWSRSTRDRDTRPYRFTTNATKCRNRLGISSANRNTTNQGAVPIDQEIDNIKNNNRVQNPFEMELMELVENEPTARPFQCDWQSCNKVCSHPPCVPMRPSTLRNPRRQTS